MNYREFIRRVQSYSGFSDRDAEIAVEAFMETMAGRLSKEELSALSSHLPEECAALAWPGMGDFDRLTGDEFLERIAFKQNSMDTDLARHQFCAVWRTLEDIMGSTELAPIRAKLPADLVTTP